MPFDITRLIRNAITNFNIRPKEKSDMTPSEAIEMLNDTIRRLFVNYGEDGLSKEANSNATLLLTAYLRSHLASKKVLIDYRLTTEAYTWLLGQIEHHFQRAKVHPGEMVGAVAA